MSHTITVEKKPKSTVEINGEIDAPIFESYREKAFLEIGKDYEIDGFRKGTVPKNILEQKIPEMYVLEEMAQMAIADLYPKILEEHKIDAIGRPAVQIKKIAKNSPLGFSIICATLPEITLPDYKKLALNRKVEEVSPVTEKEITDTIDQILTMRQTPPHEEKVEDVEGSTEETKKLELTDEFVKTLGDFKDVEDFKKKIEENLLMEKTARGKNKARQALLDGIVAESKIEVPDMLVEYELDRFMDTMKRDIERMGLSYEEYLKHLTKTETEMREEYRKDTEKKVQTEFILKEIATKENIISDEKEVEKQLEILLATYKDADSASAKAYLEDILQKEATIRFLEDQK